MYPLMILLVGEPSPELWWLARVIIVPGAIAGNVALFPTRVIVPCRGYRTCISRMQTDGQRDRVRVMVCTYERVLERTFMTHLKICSFSQKSFSPRMLFAFHLSVEKSQSCSLAISAPLLLAAASCYPHCWCWVSMLRRAPVRIMIWSLASGRECVVQSGGQK